MFKIRPYIIDFSLACFDLVLVAFSFGVARWWERFALAERPSSGGPAGAWPWLLLVGSFSWVAYSIYFELYRSRRTASPFADLVIIAKVALAALVTVQVLIQWLAIPLPSRFFFARLVCLAFATVSVARIALRLTLRKLRKHGLNTKGVLLVATPSLYAALERRIRERADYGYRLVWGVSYPSVSASSDGDLLTEFRQAIAVHKADDAILALAGEHREMLTALSRECENNGVHVRIVPDLFPLVDSETQVASFDGIPLVNVRPYRTEEFRYVVLKRIFDIIVSSIVLVFASPFLLIIAALFELTSEGPAFIVQERVGLNARKFKLYKFRTMRHRPAAHAEFHWTTRNDPNVTAFGRWLRRSNLDEFPQFLNVLKGDMSIVGPRPERPFFIERFREQIPGYMLRHYVKCGITGWAQVNGWRGDTSIRARVVHDLYYIRNWRLSFDLKIILLTLTRSFFHRNAY